MAPPRKRRAVALDNLPWKTVALPERMDDAEGFYGLEEIDDVEIVRDHASNKLSFRTAMPYLREKDDEESEWEGFNDDEKPSGSALPSERSDRHTGNESAIRPIGRNTKNEKTEKMKRKAKERLFESKTQSGGTSKVSGSTDPIGFHHLHASDDDQEPETDVSAWDPLRLSPDIMLALSRMRFSNPTAIQQASIPQAMAGHDVIGKASTGSGKTLAYGIPVLEKSLADLPATRKPVALVIAPTRELAHQISGHLNELASKLPAQGPRIATITGGLSVYKQQRLLKDADVVIGTPGRLWEVINSEAGLLTALRRISFLVVDEADRLLSEGHFKELEEILKSLDRHDVDDDDLDRDLDRPTRQTLVFSATFQKGLQRKLAGKGKQADVTMMTNRESMDYLLQKLNFREERPQYIDVNPVSQMAENLQEGLVECTGPEKDLYLYAVLLLHANARALVFANSIDAVRRLTPFLQHLNLKAHSLHSQMPQKARLRAIERFKENKASVLVATDVAARGLDIPEVQLVLHYHVPRQADVYVHRSGRTARANNAGSSVLLCSPEEVVPVRRLVAKVHVHNAAQRSDLTKASTRFFIRSIELDRQVISRLKERAGLSKKIADVELAKEKHHTEDSWLKKAAEDLGVEYDSDEFAKNEGVGKKASKGKKRREKEAEARTVSKQDVAKMKAQLKGLLSQRVNVGVSETYLSAGDIDIEQLLQEQKNGGTKGVWLGKADLLGS